jgi:hypothetical protein
VRRGGNDGIEPEMQRWLDRSEKGDDGAYKALLAARFYIQGAIGASQSEWLQLVGRASNYDVLLDKIEQRRRRVGEHVVLATFNYDTLLELACEATLDFLPNGLDEYVSHNPNYSLFKPHGSIDWVRAIPGRPAHLGAAELISMGRDIPATGEIVMREANTAAIPAIAVPVTSKDAFECPDDHVEQVKERLAETTAIVVIGWRAQEFTFLQLLHDVMPRPMSGVMKPVLIVSRTRTQAELTQQTLAPALPALIDYRISQASLAEMDEGPIRDDAGFSGFVSHFADDELNVFGSA